ncbi:MAG TPA: iron-containing alcohol dehydrogenase [Dictyoglomaceae bacterium]|nr:iron-containing alcohol dehydrogenase [Dictyoglomaceae bacterium]HOL39263.1 iron-containing alcohol dehydrogenase [Dictyoglomaceae bacterium]HPP15878.1 iron-containing alcohol dehydrogenase [Dictyoglomaceae bacterium]
MFYTLELPKKILYGRGSINTLGSELKNIGSKFIFLTGEASLKRSGYLDRIMEDLEKHEINVVLITGIPSEPTSDIIYQICHKIVGDNFDGVIGVGDGSVMDTAKVIAIGLKAKKDMRELRGIEIEDALPIVASPTTAGTGSETTRFAVITDKENKNKFLLMGKALVPTLSIIDPELTFSMSSLVTAYTGIDAFSHALESYLSRGSNVTIDIFSKSAIEEIYRTLPEAVLENSEDAKERMAYAAFRAGIAIDNAKTNLIHAMSCPLEDIYSIPHGIANGILLPAYLRFNAPFIPTEKYKFLKDIFGGNPSEKVEEFLEMVNLPLKISQATSEDVDVDLLVRRTMEAKCNLENNLRPVTEEDVYNLFKEVL